MIKYAVIIILSIVIGCGGYVLAQSYMKKRKYRAKYNTIMTHLNGFDFPRMQLCNIYACEDEMIFVAADQENRLSRDKIQKVVLYSEHDFRRRANAEGVEIGSLEGLVRGIPRKNNNKDIYILVINYLDRHGEIAVAGFVNDVLVQAVEIFVSSINKYYELITEVIEIGGEPLATTAEKEVSPKKDSSEEMADPSSMSEQPKTEEEL